MKKTVRICIAAFLIVSLLLSLCACGPKKTVLKVYNWGEYIADGVIDEFEERYNIKVVYDTFDTNEDMYAKVSAGGTNGYDIVVPSDYMVSQMISKDMLAKLDFSNIPNYKNLMESFKNMPFDPENEYCVPYLFGAVGILYNKTMVDEPVEDMSILWNPKYNQQIFMLDSIRDTIGMTLKMLGYSMNTEEPAALDAAKNKLIEQKPLVLAYATDEAKDKMVAGEGALALCYPGVGMEAVAENPDLDFAVPKNGTNVSVDCFVILKNTKVKKEAEMFINYMLEPEVAKKNAQLGYATVNSEALKLLPEEISTDTRIYPTEDILSKSEYFDYNQDRDAKYAEIWTEVKAN